MKFIYLFLFIPFLVFGEKIETIQPQQIVLDIKGCLVDFNTDNVNFIGKVIDRNIKVLDELIVIINSSNDYESVFPVIVESVDKLAKNYRTIANKKEDIRKTLEEQITKIEKQRVIANDKIKFINDKINQTQKNLSLEKEDYRQNALKTTLKFQEQERDIWMKFVNGMKFNEMIIKLRQASGGINKFIDILSVNADVYNQASVTLKTIQSYKKATKDLQEIISVVDLGNNLIESWGKLAIIIDGAMTHIETIETMDFGQISEESQNIPIRKDVPQTIIFDTISNERN